MKYVVQITALPGKPIKREYEAASSMEALMMVLHDPEVVKATKGFMGNLCASALLPHNEPAPTYRKRQEGLTLKAA